ncbi:TenA family protein [Methylobrevis pamukkalensis]|uniref:Aminopyrimidine aminohydrolase n=1 Tax=Methylobrevis pamukkalensis TaxID=1439726 RepID=A0A1E3H4U9_9HYPH|nr:TenA family protein [Methylobrevis pamukkalensis]ODN71344.1 Thiaminase-2 [Methylobrevis pamukkalensis]
MTDLPVSFSDELRNLCADDWRAATEHRFVDELLAGTVDPDVMRAYLVQDYQFIDGFVALLGSAIANADHFASRLAIARFLAMITSDENTYFVRAFDALGVSEADRFAPQLAAPTADFQALMARATAGGSYVRCLAVLVVAEWLYMSWAQRRTGPLPADFVHAEWITLHDNAYFNEVVGWLRSELDRAAGNASEAEREIAAALFTEAVALERAFFDHLYA